MRSVSTISLSLLLIAGLVGCDDDEANGGATNCTPGSLDCQCLDDDTCGTLGGVPLVCSAENLCVQSGPGDAGAGDDVSDMDDTVDQAVPDTGDTGDTGDAAADALDAAADGDDSNSTIDGVVSDVRQETGGGDCTNSSQCDSGLCCVAGGGSFAPVCTEGGCPAQGAEACELPNTCQSRGQGDVQLSCCPDPMNPSFRFCAGTGGC